jgi:hypothetical protein
VSLRVAGRTPKCNTEQVRIEERRCEDSMSGEPFAATVTVTVNGRLLDGFGRALR